MGDVMELDVPVLGNMYMRSDAQVSDNQEAFEMNKNNCNNKMIY